MRCFSISHFFSLLPNQRKGKPFIFVSNETPVFTHIYNNSLIFLYFTTHTETKHLSFTFHLFFKNILVGGHVVDTKKALSLQKISIWLL